MRVVIGWKSVLYESLYDQAQLCTHFDWFSLMIYWRTMDLRATGLSAFQLLRVPLYK